MDVDGRDKVKLTPFLQSLFSVDRCLIDKNSNNITVAKEILLCFLIYVFCSLNKQ